MADEEQQDPPEMEELTAPAWVVTYGDMMSLLLCFFVLLLAFSEQDTARFKELSGSLKYAFGVQRNIPVMNVPMGDTVVSPLHMTALINEVLIEEMQQAVLRKSTGDKLLKSSLKPGSQDETLTETAEEPMRYDNAIENAGLLDLIKHIEAEYREDRLILRIPSRFIFEDESAQLKSEGLDIIQLIFNRFKKYDGEIIVEAHTDNSQPGTESLYRNNWELSTAQAVSIVRELIHKGIKPDNISAAGHSDTKPLGPNDTPIQRERNRRVEFLVFPKPREVVLPLKDESAKQPRLGPKGFIDTFFPSVREDKEKEEIRKSLLEGVDTSESKS